jgi:hypothetical protein
MHRLSTRLARTPAGNCTGKIGHILAAGFTLSLSEIAQSYLREAEYEVQGLQRHLPSDNPDFNRSIPKTCQKFLK